MLLSAKMKSYLVLVGMFYLKMYWDEMKRVINIHMIGQLTVYITSLLSFTRDMIDLYPIRLFFMKLHLVWFDLKLC